MGLGQVNTIDGAFLPDTTETAIVSIGEKARAAEAKRTSGLFEAVLLAVSFIFLLLGLLPSQLEQPSATRVPPLQSRFRDQSWHRRQ